MALRSSPNDYDHIRLPQHDWRLFEELKNESVIKLSKKDNINQKSMIPPNPGVLKFDTTVRDNN